MRDTEPIIRCNEGTARTDLKFGPLEVHDFTRSTGLQHLIAPECSIFVLGSDVTSTEVWNGVRQPQRAYQRGDVVFLPGRTDLSTAYLSGPYSETLLRIPCALIRRAMGDEDVGAMEMRYFLIPERSTFGLATTVRNLARAWSVEPIIPMLAESLSVALAAKVVRAMSRPAIDQCTMVVSLAEHRRRRALDFIEANLGQPITLADIADAAALSPHHFARAFKASMGVSPVRYVWQRRIERARGMLKNQEIPLADVALACGYSAQSHFTTTFKLATGFTPAAYRKAVI